MKKVFAFVFVVVLIFALAACGGGGSNTPANTSGSGSGSGSGSTPETPSEVYTLKLHSHDPEASPCGEFLTNWATDVMNASGGRINIDLYHGATLGGARDTLEMLSNGTCEIAWGLPAFFPGVFPASEVATLPMVGFKNGEQSSRIMWELYESFPELQAEYTDYKVLLLHTNSGAPISSRNSQFSALSDFRGINIRGNAGPPTEFITALEAAPVGIGVNELYEAINNGTLDAAIVDWSAIRAYQLFETCKFYLDANIGPSNCFLLMNWDAYNNLPADLQSVIDERSGKSALQYCGTAWNDAEIAVRKTIEERGDVIYNLEPAEHARLKGVADEVADAWIAKMEGSGLPGQALYDKLIELIEQDA